MTGSSMPTVRLMPNKRTLCMRGNLGRTTKTKNTGTFTAMYILSKFAALRANKRKSVGTIKKTCFAGVQGRLEKNYNKKGGRTHPPSICSHTVSASYSPWAVGSGDPLAQCRPRKVMMMLKAFVNVEEVRVSRQPLRPP